MGIDKLANKKTTLTQNDSLFHNEVSIPLRHPKNLGKWGTLSASLLICGAALTSQAQPVMAAEVDAPTNSIVVQTGTSTDDLIVSQGYGDQDFLNYLGSSAQKLAEKNVGGLRNFWQWNVFIGWSNFSSDDYEDVIRHIKYVTKGHLWEIEEYWKIDDKDDKDDNNPKQRCL